MVLRVIFVGTPHFTLRLVSRTFSLPLRRPTRIIGTRTNRNNKSSFFRVRMARFGQNNRTTRKRNNSRAIMSLTRLRTKNSVTLRTRLTTNNKSIRRLTTSKQLRFITTRLGTSRLYRFRYNTRNITTLIVSRFNQRYTAMTTHTVNFTSDRQTITIPNSTRAIIRTFSTVKFTNRRRAFAITQSRFIRNRYITIAVSIRRVTLRALTAFIRHSSRQIVTILRLTRITKSFRKDNRRLK